MMQEVEACYWYKCPLINFVEEDPKQVVAFSMVMQNISNWIQLRLAKDLQEFIMQHHSIADYV